MVSKKTRLETNKCTRQEIQGTRVGRVVKKLIREHTCKKQQGERKRVANNLK